MAPPTLLELTDVAVTYGAVPVLRGVSLRVAAGERVALIGPSGAGKTTLLGVVNGTVAPANGAVTLDGVPVLDNERWRRAHGREIATIPQHLHLSGPLRVVHNVNAGRLGAWSTWRALWSLVSPREVDEARAVLGAVGIADKLFTRTDLLSGGEQQRVAIARALRQSPRLLLADEPTASLDPARAAEVMRLLASAAAGAGCALVVSQHDVGLALAACERIVGLRDGRVAFDCPVDTVTAEEIETLYAIGAPA